jgi:hypothetical protein
MEPDHPDRPACLGNAAAGCMVLYELTADPAAVDRLLRIRQSLVDELPESDRVRVVFRRDLLPFLARVIVAEPGPDVLGRLVVLAREAATGDRADRPIRLEALSVCLHAASAPLTAVELSVLDSSVELGYLSACETARSSEVLADEVVHIATALQLAGCRPHPPGIGVI